MSAKGRYDILEILGEGGMGIVYRAMDPVLNREVTVKTIRDPQDKTALDLFKRECAVLSSITHPNIVEIFDIGETEEAGARRPYFVMPLLPGTTLQELIKTSSPRLTVERSVLMISQVCRGLQAAHDHGLIHRDLKPSNLFVLPDDSVKIIDFGMAHLTNHRSATGLKGTLLYMAPEQLQLKEQPTPLSDQFSLAVVCYEILARRHPFTSAGQEDLAQAILHYTPPPVSQFNPLVNPSICQVIHKALAKQPFHRFSDVRALSDCLQKAARGEPIEIFDPARIAPRLARARKAFETGDLDDAAERIKELESESFLAPEIDELRKQIEDVRRAKTVRRLLEAARRRFDEGEYVRALQKVQEILNRDSNNTDAFTLKGAIESKRSATQIEEWFHLANQHMENHAYTHARQALEKVLDLRPKEVRAQTLLTEVERREQEHIRLRNEKEEAYQSALNAYRRGDVNSAYTKAERLLDLDRRAPYSTSPEQGAMYQKLYEEVRSKRNQLATQEAEARRHLDNGNFDAAKAICDEVLSAYPSNVLFGALRDDVEQAHRQEISAYLAKVEKEAAEEADLNRKVAILEEASRKYPSESRFKESSQQVRARRDLVDSIAGRARTAEEGRQFSEALGLWETLRSIYPKYPGLEIEIDRLHKRRDQQLRADAKDHWVSQIDQALTIRNYAKATSLASDALAEFPGDPELSALAKQIQQAQTRASEAVEKTNRGKDLHAAGNPKQALDLLREALQLDPHNPVVRAGLLEVLLNEAGPLIDADWRAAEALVQEALELDPSNHGAKSLNTLIQDKRQAEEVSAALSRARESQAQGNLKEAIAELDKIRPLYPRENRLIQFRSVLQEGLSAKDREEVRARDLMELNELARQSHETTTVTELDSIFLRSGAYSKYGADPEFRKPLSEIEERLRHEKEAAQTPAESGAESNAELSKVPPVAVPVAPPTKKQAPVKKTRAVPAGAFREKLDAIWRSTASKFFWPILGFSFIALTLVLVVHKRPRPHPRPVGVRTIEFHVIPEDATILVDNQPISGTTAEVTPGSHSVEVDRIGYISEHQTVDDRSTTPIEVTLQSATPVIRIMADSVKTPKAMVDAAAVELSQDGSFSPPEGKHTLKFLDGNSPIFSVEFQADIGLPTRLLSAPRVSGRDIPMITAVSNLGSHAFAYSSVAETKAGPKDGEFKPIPSDGLELTVPDGVSEIAFDDGKLPSFPVESGKAPVLSIRVGTATKGTLVITSVDGARVFINGRPSSRLVQAQTWRQLMDPGSYTVQLRLNGYDDSQEQTFKIAAGQLVPGKFDLVLAITMASLQVQGGTPGAQIWLDRAPIGFLDPNGSFGPYQVQPGERSIQFTKENFEPSPELKKTAAVKQTIPISGAEAALKEFGRLVLTSIQPPEAAVTIQRQGGQARTATSRTIPLQEGTYTVRGSASNEYEPFEQPVQIHSGQPTSITVNLPRKPTTAVKPPPPPPPPPKLPEVPALFDDDPTGWINNHGFWEHKEGAYFVEAIFERTFEVEKIKKRFGMEDVKWIVFDNDDTFWEFKLDEKNFSKQRVEGRKVVQDSKKPHNAGSGASYRVSLNVAADQIITEIGDGSHTFMDVSPRKVGPRIGRTGFTNKVGLKLIE
jgi:serine/threonine-protein kinase